MFLYLQWLTFSYYYLNKDVTEKECNEVMFDLPNVENKFSVPEFMSPPVGVEGLRVDTDVVCSEIVCWGGIYL